MIFVTLGTQKFQMNRLIKAVDELAASGRVNDDFFIQTGVSTYKPKNCGHIDFMDSDQYAGYISECNLLITHAGVGTIITGIKASKPVIVVPRLAHFGEHVDDHQTQIAKAFSDKGCVLCCENLDELANYIEKSKTYEFQDYNIKNGNVEDTILRFMSMFS
ncbi:MAG: glycosyl transferase [Acetatifactor sp.]|nr:glycosyl transferase [Acetatifactor sp.]